MVERKNLVTIFVSVLIILGIIFFISFSDEFKHALQGAAFGSEPLDPCAEVCFSPYENDDGGMADDDGDGHEQDWLFAGHCSRLQPWFCPSNPEDGECGILIENCDRCGCLHSGYVCNIENKCSHYCSGHWDCDADEICIDVNWELVNILEEDRTGCYADGYGNGDSCGMCRESSGDGYCLIEDLSDFGYNGGVETCQDNYDDCVDFPTSDCLEEDNLVCGPFGICDDASPIEDICADGTLYGDCSDTSPQYCDEDGNLLNDCQTCGCPSETLVCLDSGSCTTSGGEDPVPITDYCTQAGGVCAESCDSDYYVLEDTEDYSDLHEACRDKDEDYVCCYPYANDELNDCEYYGGSCQEECSGDYYHSEVPYLDDECSFYSDSESLCCLKYDVGPQNSGEKDTEENTWEKIFGSPDTDSEDYNKENYIHLGENISLHRNYAFGFGAALVIILFVITVYYPKFKNKK